MTPNLNDPDPTDNDDSPTPALAASADLLAAAIADASSASAAQPDDPDALLALLDNPDAPQREQAFTLYCHGFRSTTIGNALRVHPRTVRRWLGDMRRLIAAESRTDRAAELLRAIESHRAIVSAAWEAYEHERELEREILSGQLDHIRRRVRRSSGSRSAAAPTAGPRDTPDRDDTVLEELERPRVPHQSARYLSVALAAEREIGRLQGLYDQIQRDRPPVHVHISMDPTGSNIDAPLISAQNDHLPA